MKEIHYNRNFLKKVIFRLDFGKIELGHLDDFYKKELQKEFPSKDTKKGQEGTLKFEDGKVTQATNEFLAFTFENKQKTKRFEISERYAFIEYDEYNHSEELFADIKNLIEKFTDTFGVKTINRLGLRFVNEIGLKESNPLDWKEYINKNLICSLDFGSKGGRRVSRTMGQIVFKFDKGDLTFNFGIFNKEFPNEIATKEFILDFDSYSILPFETSEEGVLERAKKYHNKIEDLFESSITKKFRDILNKK